MTQLGHLYNLFIEQDFSVDFVIVLMNVFKTDKPWCLSLIDQDDVCHITICTITEPFAFDNFYIAAFTSVYKKHLFVVCI